MKKLNGASSKDEALDHAVQATEYYMQALKLSETSDDKARLRKQCKTMMSRAEDIKSGQSWTTKRKDVRSRFLKAPVSERLLGKSEKIVLLESSKLHGCIFPPVSLRQEDTVGDGVETVFVYVHSKSSMFWLI